MKLSSTLVGKKLKGLTRDVSWRETTNYAAAVGDANPRYLDDSCDGGLIAPPLFAVALTWPLMANISQQLDDALPMEVLPTMVHATEHLIFHNPVRPGTNVKIQSEVCAMVPTKAGTLAVLRSDAEAGGEKLFTEYGGALFRGVACDKEMGADNIPQLPEWNPQVNAAWEAQVPTTRQAPFVYDGCTDIIFPIHTSVSFAKAVGLPDIILQGTATLAMAAKEIVDRQAEGNPTRLKEIACRFTGMVIPGSTINVRLLPTQNPNTPAFQVMNAEGKPALDRGHVLLGS